MDFGLNNEQIKYCKKIDLFLNEEIRPYLSNLYKKGEFPKDILLKLGKRRWLGFKKLNNNWSETLMQDNVIFYEKFSSISPGLAVSILAHASLGLYSLFQWGDAKQIKKHFLPGVKGEKIVAFANTEPGAGSDVANISLRAQKCKDGFVFNGTKMFVTNCCSADIVVTSAVTNPRAKKKSERLSLFIVEPNISNIKRRKINKMVWHPSDLGTISFKDCWVPKENILGEYNGGFKQIMQTFTNSRIAIAALTLGTGFGAYNLALERAHKRRVFDKKIIEHQAKAFEFAIMATKVEASRLLIQKAAWLKDRNREFRFDASVAKFFSVEETRKIAIWAADIFGASGIIQDSPIFKFPLDAWASAIGEGTQDIQKLIISTEIKKRFKDANKILEEK